MLTSDDECYVVDFLRETRREHGSVWGLFRRNLKTKSLPKALIHLALGCRSFLQAKGRSVRQDYVDTLFRLDKNASLTEDRRLECSGYDALITGSDQVFAGCEPFFFLQTTQEPQPLRLAYAPSYGKLGGITPEQWVCIKEWLSPFAALSCREQDGAARTAELLGGRECPVVLDPTMLVSHTYWQSLERRPENAPEGDFVFCYQLWRNETEIAEAQKVADKLQIPLFALKQYNVSMERYHSMGPREFLWCINHARYVVTSSFHGSVFSILFGTPFLSFRSDAPQSRLVTLLQTVGLEERRVRRVEEIDLQAPFPSREELETRLAPLREKSIQYLKDALALARSQA